MASPLPPCFLDEIRAAVGANHVLTDTDRCRGFATDWTGRFVGSTPAVIRPANPVEVVDVVRVCDRHRVAIIPQGGNTGMVGGSVPLAGEVVVSLTRLDEIGPVDAATRQVTVGAGTTLAALQRRARNSGLDVGVDIGARDSATIGGMVATNAGGMRFLRYGGMREQITGLEAVLADGSMISHLGGLDKDNTGYDWASLLCGSEGTLGVITRARLRLVPIDAHSTVALIAFGSTAAAVDAVQALRDRVSGLAAAEFFLHDALTLVERELGVASPFGPSSSSNPPGHAFLVAEVAGDDRDAIDVGFAAAIDSLVDVVDAAVADGGRATRLWEYRERIPEAVARLGTPHKLDVTVPAAELAAFIDSVPAVISSAAPGATTILFGHVADGNVHVNVVGPAPDDDRVDRAVLEYVASLGGSISAEHGVGTVKRRWLHLNRQPEELALFRRIKTALDPVGILNPGALLPAST